MRLGISGSGYLTVHDGDEWCYVHRLAAVAEHGFEAVVGHDVHHDTGIPELNARDRLVPLRRADHADLTLNR